MTKITLDQFCNQWAPNGNTRILLTKLEFQIFDFTTRAGEISREHFLSSFAQKSFAGSGTKWPPRKSKWARRHRHPMMVDEGTLRASIKGHKGKMGYGGVHGKKAKGIRATYDIRTGERTRAVTGKRGLNSRSNGSYAAIHNTDPARHNFTRNQHTSLKPEQRQFMGHSKALDAKIAALIPDIFAGIPGSTA